jgi:hypothetical protein
MTHHASEGSTRLSKRSGFARTALACLFLAGMVNATAAAGCGAVFEPTSGSEGSGGSGSNSAGTGGSGGNGAGGGTTPGCDPSLVRGAVPDDCGIFVSVSKGDDGNTGTAKNKPVKTLSHAMSIANGKTVYACAELFPESVEAPEGVVIFGGLDCSGDWSFQLGQRTIVRGDDDAIAVTLNGDAQIFDVDVAAGAALAKGSSSIGLLARGGEVELTRSTVSAQDGAPGEDGQAQPPVPNGDDGDGGTNSLPGCTSLTTIEGGAGGQRSCDGDSVNGGRGGTGTPDGSGLKGADGEPQPRGTAPTNGLGQKGQDGSSCLAGNAGDDGGNGEAGEGASGIGDLTTAGYVGPLAEGGKTNGQPGQGGGGGGGAKECMSATTMSGPSGGGGGSGGCGGKAGHAGGAAGSSIGIVSVNAKLVLTDVTIDVGQGGRGGKGGDGQSGGLGGLPGAAGGNGACPGGTGGQGGRGGSGGGGLGGHSIGIAFKGGPAPSLDGSITISSPGAGGIGGDLSEDARGADGRECETLDFSGNGTCT